MTHLSDDSDELRQLLDALCEESISPAQVRRLEELVLGQPEAEAFYVQYMALYADLSRRFAGRPAVTEQSLRDRLAERSTAVAASAAPARSVRGRSVVLVLTALAVGVLVAVALLHRPGAVGPLPDDVAAQPAEQTDDSVAVLMHAPGAEWAAGGPAPRTGSPLRPGWLRLKAGAAHIEFYGGATVILEGPADLELVSRTQAYCARGKLRATVPPQAQGFTIASPAMDLVDRGTEFGLSVGAGDATEVHVFQGRVDLYDAGAGHDAAPRQALTTGQAARRDGPGAVRPITADPAAFRTARDLADRTTEDTLRRQAAWRAASAALARDPSVVAYYPFEPDHPWSRTLPDLALADQPPASAARDGAVVGCGWVTSRWAGKHGLEFKRVSDRVRLNVPGEFSSLTLAAWVRVDALPNVNNSLLMADGWDVGGLHWQIGGDGMLILGIKAPLKERNAHYHALGVFTPDRLGQWVHLAVTYDQPAGAVTHYVDGAAVAQLPILFDIPLRIGSAEVGNWNTATRRDSVPVRHFSGCMDELLLFSRPLAEAEIERLYTQGRPPA